MSFLSSAKSFVSY